MNHLRETPAEHLHSRQAVTEHRDSTPTASCSAAAPTQEKVSARGRLGNFTAVTAQIFIDYRQVPEDEPIAGIGLYFSVRTDAALVSTASGIRMIAAQIEPQAMVENIAPMSQLVWNSIARPRLYTVLLGTFAVVAVVLAAVGLYGVMAYSVAQRTREIGLRLALGARPARVMRLVLGESALVTLPGIALGLGGAAVLTRYLEQLLFGLTPLDPATYAAVAIIFATVTLIASYVPARRAAHVDPLVALKYE